jgi:KTSC domain
MAEQVLNLKQSANVKGATYDPDTQTLTVQLNGGTYSYAGVSAEKAQAFADADSHGNFLHTQIKGQHVHTKVG